MQIDRPAAEVPEHRSGDADHLNLLSVAAIFVRQWRVVASGLLAGIVLGAAFIIVKPDVYTADVVLVPSEERSGASLLAAQLPAGLAGLAGAAGQERQKLITAILKSRTLADSIFSELYPSNADRQEREVFIRQLRKRSKIEVTADGAFIISVRDRDPQQAAQIANEHAELINRISADIGRQALGVKRDFLERQLAEAQRDLVASEEALLSYQQQTDAPEIQEQSRQTVEAAAELQRIIYQKEIEVLQLRRVATPNNPELRAAVAELDAMRQQMRRLTGGSSSAGDVFVPLGSSPELKVGSLRLLREFTKNEQIYLSLTAALAETQLDVQNNMPVVALLDRATVPDRPSGIPRVITLGLITWLGLLAGLGMAVGVEYLDRLRRDPGSQPFFEAWARVRRTRLPSP